MKYLILIAFTAIFYTALFLGSFLIWQDKSQSLLISPKLSLRENKDTLTLLFMGDIMLDRGVEWHIRQNQDNWKWPFLKIADYLKDADLVFANLESVISNKGIKQGSIYSFRANPKTLEGLVFAGINVVSVANNHSLDYGTEALLDSIERLNDVGIATAGGGINKEEARIPVIKHYRTSRYDSVAIGILAYTMVGSPLWQAGEQSPGVSWMDESKLPQLKKDIESAREQADIVIVSFHFGEEYQTKPSTVQQLLSRSAIDAGASLVIGHHPHVVQPVERYKHGWIAYSLGNFVFDQGFPKETMQGMILKVLVHKNNIIQVTPLMIEISSEFQPAISKESI